MAIDEQLIRQLVIHGRAHDLHSLLLGISPYCRFASPYERTIQSEAILPKEEQDKLRLLWTLAIHHLEFMTKYGLDLQEVREGSVWHFAHSREFDEWLRAGTPGLSEEALCAYLRDHPLKGTEGIKGQGDTKKS